MNEELGIAIRHSPTLSIHRKYISLSIIFYGDACTTTVVLASSYV